MAGITQTIPNYFGGISEQADQLKPVGTVKDAVNVVPDPVWGLYKRPGAKRITPNGNPLANVSTDAKASWFHYYRDPSEGPYVGQIAQDGTVRMWDASSGSEMHVHYGTGGATAVKGYLAHTNSKEDIQALTIMDSTFVTNRTEPVQIDTSRTTTRRKSTIGDTANLEEKYFAYIDLLKAENGRQYAFNVYNKEDTFTYERATSIEFGGEGDSDDMSNGGLLERNDTLFDGDGSGACRGIGTQVFTYNGHQTTGNATTQARKQRNLCFRITVTGQNGLKEGATPDDQGFDSSDYRCTYHRDLTLLHGGEGWHHMDTTAPLKWYTSDGSTLAGSGGLIDNNSLDHGTFNGYKGYWNSGHINGSGENRVAMTQAPAGAHGGHPAQYRIRVRGTESINTKGYIDDHPVGVIRPRPTPFDADTAVTTDTILAGIMKQLSHNKFTGTGSQGSASHGITSLSGNVSGTGIYCKIIGSGLYIYSNTKAFNVEILESDLMRVMQTEINDVTKLPLQCRHGYIVKVSNSQASDEDDYWLQFKGVNDSDGPGSWVECAKPGIMDAFAPNTMPHAIQRKQDDSSGTITGSANALYFEVGQWSWAKREVGDDKTNLIPTFAGHTPVKNSEGDITSFPDDNRGKINKILFFRNRLALLSGENVILSRPGTFAEPNFWADTALTVSAIDPVDIAAAGTFPSELFDGIETNNGLLVFSRNQQFLLSSDDTTFNPDTAKLRSISTYFYNENLPPISLGVTHGFLDNSGRYSKFQELQNVQREGEANILETSKPVPTLLPTNLDLIANSRENGMVFLGQAGSDTVYVYKYLNSPSPQGTERKQSAWVKWKFLNPLKYQFVLDDAYYFIDDEDFLQRIMLVNSSENLANDIWITQNGIEYLVHIDNWIETTGNSNSYDADADTTTFTFPWMSGVTYDQATDSKMVLFDTDMSNATGGEDIASYEEATGTVRYGIYAEATARSGNNVTFPGRWGSINGKYPFVGWVYEYKVDLPTIYPLKPVGQSIRAEVNGSLTLHRLKLNFGKVGVYETTLTRIGKDDYTDLHESGMASEYHASDMPWVEEEIKSIPVYEKNTNVKITLKSSHPSPATLHSMSWEGDFSKLTYRRV